MSEIDGSSVLITGGSGSLEKSLVEHLLKNTSARRIAIYSRDELKQFQLKSYFNNDPRLRWFIGDVRDVDRLKRALHGVDFVIHAVALKQVDTGEYNPMEFIKTNVLGSQNVIEASIDAGVRKVVALSTDKASSPINLYGATKLTADKLFVAAIDVVSINHGTLAIHSGQTSMKLDLVKTVMDLERRGIGEILIQSISHDGKWKA